MKITYTHTITPETKDIIALYKASKINRPIKDTKRIHTMYAHANLIVSAWNGTMLVGIARALTDFSYCCYISDLAVHDTYQRLGIGKQILKEIRTTVGSNCSLILLAAPSAMEYYPKVGFSPIKNGFIILRKQ